jgi:APA family basic amino acid/polyamine antiporter
VTSETSSPSAATPGSLHAPFTRRATGLVRELGLWDIITYNAAISTPIGVALSLSLFFAYGAFPGANLVVALLLALVGVFFTYVMFALLSAAMPRVGGDYTYISRILNPAVALASNVTFVAALVLAIGWIAAIAVRQAIAPALAQIGLISGNAWWIHAGETISKNGWTFVLGSLMVIGCGVIGALGTKLAGRTMTILYLMSFGGALLTIIVLAVTSHESFVNHLNSFAKPITHSNDTYNATIAAGQKAGIVYPDHSGYSFKNTIGAVFVAYGLTFSAYSSVYIAGEMKGAGRRERQLKGIFIGGYGQAIFLILSVLVLTHTLGYDFFAAASTGNLAIPVAPYANLFVGIVVGNTGFAALLAVLFVFAILPWMYANAAILYRAPFAWAFDGLVPRRLTAVNERTHTPVFAIAVTTALSVAVCAWSSFTLSFLTVFSYLVLFAFVTIALVGVAAVMMPSRLPEVYKGSAADWRVAGLPVLQVVGVVAIVWNVGMMALAIKFHANIGIPHIRNAIEVLGGTIVAGVLFYYVARAVQRSRGVDIDLAYRAIPPE